MPRTVDAPKLDEVQHEYFCQPREGASAPRLEGFTAYEDDPETNRSRPAAFCTRCMECGAISYRPVDA